MSFYNTHTHIHTQTIVMFRLFIFGKKQMPNDIETFLDKPSNCIITHYQSKHFSYHIITYRQPPRPGIFNYFDATDPQI